MKKVVLVINNFSWYGKRAFRTWLPAVPIITALIKNICIFSVIDANVNNMDFEETQQAISKSDAQIVLISALSIDYQLQYHKVAQLAKAALPDCITMMGGVYPTTLPHQVLKDLNVDIVMQGHAEERLPRILQAVMDRNLDALAVEPGIGFRRNGKVIITQMNTHLKQVSEMVKPDYSYLEIDKYFDLQANYNARNYSTECAEKRSVNIIASYGCPYNCFFCANRSLSGSQVVYRPIDHILEEIDYFVKEHKVEQISFMDDNIVSDKQRAKTLFRALVERKYCLEVQIGNLAAWDLDDEML